MSEKLKVVTEVIRKNVSITIERVRLQRRQRSHRSESHRLNKKVSNARSYEVDKVVLHTNGQHRGGDQAAALVVDARHQRHVQVRNLTYVRVIVINTREHGNEEKAREPREVER